MACKGRLGGSLSSIDLVNSHTTKGECLSVAGGEFLARSAPHTCEGDVRVD